MTGDNITGFIILFILMSVGFMMDHSRKQMIKRHCIAQNKWDKQYAIDINKLHRMLHRGDIDDNEYSMRLTALRARDKRSRPRL